MKKHNFIHALSCALKGVYLFTSRERNAKIHAAMVIIVICAALFFKLAPIEWAIIIICMAMVISCEMMNTAVEKLCDKIEPGYNNTIKCIKDIAAAAVLCVSIAAVIAGLVIFLPYFKSLFG